MPSVIRLLGALSRLPSRQLAVIAAVLFLIDLFLPTRCRWWTRVCLGCSRSGCRAVG